MAPEHRIYWSFIPGGSISLLLLLILHMIPYPNTQSMILKYRSGVYQSLHSRTFQKYRRNSGKSFRPVLSGIIGLCLCSLVLTFVLLSEALIYYNAANMIYAAIGAGGLFFILFAGALFLLFWPPTSYFIQLLIAWGIGLVSDCR